MKHFRVYWLTCVLAISGAAVSATTIVLPTDDQLVTKSPVIVKGTVVTSQAVLRDGAIWTETALDVEQALKGNVSGRITVREIGGEIDGRITKIYGSPAYREGEHVLAFLTPTPRGDFQTMDLFVGKFSEERTAAGQRLWSRDDVVADVSLLDANFQPIEGKNVKRDAGGFEQFVRDRAAGRGSKSLNYGVVPPSTGGSHGVKGEFTLISEPNVYRWFAFDNGGSASWRSFGAQTGYSGGGVNEIQTAMGAWTNFSGAKIRYTYAGAGSGSSPGLSATNGSNDVLFNDPNGEIAGSFNKSTGGVVGLGGFNGVAGTQSWTAPFSADAQHQQKTYSAGNIVEGNLVIQDGVSPAAGISSALLAEIVAHEFGHTLGLGHSADSTALMYATVTGLGASLRADDQSAASWLYPSGSTPPPPPPPPAPTVPNAPSGLSVAQVGSSGLQLQWLDNSSNESGFYVYLASATGPFNRIVQTAANVTSVIISNLAPGTYRFYVSAFNSAGEGTSGQVSGSVGAPAASLVAEFAISPASGIAGVTAFGFTDQSTGPVSGRNWNFGDGASSSATNPTHVYASAGLYTVTLTVSGTGGPVTRQHGLTVNSPAPAAPPVSAAFSFAPSSPYVGDTVSFSDSSSGAPGSWSWSFGDGAFSNQRNPAHAYVAPGTYTVTLTASNGATSSNVSQAITVRSLEPFRSLVSAAAQTNGAGGSVWRTELTLFNAGSDTASVTFMFLPSGGSPQSRQIVLGSKQSVTYANALLELFSIGSGSGGITIEATSPLSTPDLKVSSRTFTTGSVGTFGQAVPQLGTDDLGQTLWVTGIESDADYRTNIGLVNRSAVPVGVSLSLFASNGVMMARSDVTLSAQNFQQGALPNYFPSVAGQSLDGLTLRAVAGAAGAVSVYASVVDNRTQDPIYIQGIPAPIGSMVAIAAVGRAPGVGGTYWRSDVTMMNPTASIMRLRWRYLPAGADNRGVAWSGLDVGPGQTRVLRDVASMFGVSTGTGALEIGGFNGSGPIVTSRTYTTAATGGTYGQSIDPAHAFRSESYIPGLRSDGFFRSNAGFYNAGDVPIDVGVRLVGLYGNEIANTFISVPAHSQVQASLAALFPNVNVSALGSVTLHAQASAATLFAYGSIVDNASGDPVFFAGM